MNILIKLMSIVSLVIAPTLAQISKSTAAVKHDQKTETKYQAPVTKAGDKTTVELTAYTNNK